MIWSTRSRKAASAAAAAIGEAVEGDLPFGRGGVVWLLGFVFLLEQAHPGRRRHALLASFVALSS